MIAAGGPTEPRARESLAALCIAHSYPLTPSTAWSHGSPRSMPTARFHFGLKGAGEEYAEAIRDDGVDIDRLDPADAARLKHL